MRIGLHPVAWMFAGATALVAQESPGSDPYADEPYWYQPGHPLDPAEATSIETAPGFVAERILTVPRELGSWTALAVEADGRLIAAAQHRPGLYRVTPPAGPQVDTRVEPLGGAAARLGWAHGLLVAFDSLYVMVAEPNEAGVSAGLHRLQDRDGDGEYEHATRLFALDGVGEHGPHNVIVGPDGRTLVLMIGNGTRLPELFAIRRPTATSGVDHAMPPGFESSQHSAQGWVLQCGPAGENPTVLASGLRNPFDLALNEAGDLFTFDSDAEWDLGAPWYRPTRIVQLVSGGEYGWRSDAAVWPEHFEDSVAPVLNIGPGSPTGVVFGSGTRFPARYQRALFALDWTFATVHAVFLEPDGAGYRGQSELFLGGVGLPLTHVVVGIDGALYLNVGGRRLGSAIYRVRYVGDEPTTPVAPAPALPPLHQLRRNLEAFHGRSDPAALAQLWPHLGHPDRAIRFAARVALESQPLPAWRDQVLEAEPSMARLNGLLALARQGKSADLVAITKIMTELPWGEFAAADQLRGLRIIELALARGGEDLIPHHRQVQAALRPLLPSPDATVNRELARVLCLAGDRSVIDPLLELMAADTGERPAEGLEIFGRNPKYGQAIRDMLESAPLVERMHHAQMLLWLIDAGTTEQRARYFSLLGDALRHSKGGHSYREFWRRIQEEALQRVPAAEREKLLALSHAGTDTSGDVAAVGPEGPGREWKVADVEAAVAAGLQGRDFARGEAMYRATGCVTCHRLGRAGGTMGPDLSGLGQRFTLRDVIDAIVEPSRAVSDQYRMTLLRTADGRTISGRIVSRDAQETRIATNLLRPSQTEAVPAASIVSEQDVPVSTMPSGLLQPLNENEVLDLLAYLMSGGDSAHRYFRAEEP